MSAFIDLGAEYNQVKEPEIVPQGRYQLLCKDAIATEKKDEDSGLTKHSIRVQLQVQNPPEDVTNPSAIFAYLALPGEIDEYNDTSKGNEPGTSRSFKLLNIKRFIQCFGIPMDGTGFNPEDIKGTEAQCDVGVGDFQGRAQNNLVLPPAAEEG